MQHLAALGRAVVVDVADPVLHALSEEVFVDLAAQGRPDEEPLPVTVSGTGPWSIASPAHLATAVTLQAALTNLLTAVNLTAVASTPLLAFHSAVVSRGHEVLVVPGRSGLGKSTLTACLLRQGWDYVSDEALALDWQTAEVVAYPRPMALDAWSCAAAGVTVGVPCEGETAVTATALGARVERSPGAVTKVVLLERLRGAAARSEPVDPNEGLAELLQRGFTSHHDGGTALRRLAELLRRSEVVRLRVGDPPAAAALLSGTAS